MGDSTTSCELTGGPTAVDDAFTNDEDTIMNVAAPGVLANDLDNGAPPSRWWG